MEPLKTAEIFQLQATKYDLKCAFYQIKMPNYSEPYWYASEIAMRQGRPGRRAYCERKGIPCSYKEPPIKRRKMDHVERESHYW